ncbi:MAG: type IX secretion system sortase PorU [Bacteroidota bacterium]
MLKGRFLFLAICLLLGMGSSAFAQSSVLARGNWYKIGVVQSGMHRIDADFLQRLGISINTINPVNLRLYGNGGGMLPQANSAARPTDLTENAIFVSGEGDGQFDNQDYLLFYAQGPHLVNYDTSAQGFRHQTNLYSDTAYYFLNLADTPGKRVSDQASVASVHNITTFDDYVFHEKELKNLLQSGREWVGESFDFSTDVAVDFDLPGVIAGETTYLTSSVLGMAAGNTRFQLRLNGESVGTQSVPAISGGRYDFVGRMKETTFSTKNIAGNSSPLRVTVEYDKQGVNAARGYLNFIGLQTKRALQLYGTQTVFRSIESTQAADATFLIAGTQSSCKIWDITDPLQPQNQLYTLNGDVASFGDSSLALKEFIVFKDNGSTRFDVPVSGWKVANQDLHGLAMPQLLVITHPAFRKQAQRLADFRHSHDGLSVALVTTEEVFNEFSSGKQDVTAIRDLAKYLYDKDSTILQYVLLFGDATYDYKSRTSSQAAFVPIYEARESLHPIFSYSSDDYFGFLEKGEGEWIETNAGDHTLDIGVGRLPVKTVEESQTIVDKLIRYANGQQIWGKWRNRISFVADDGDDNTHQLAADDLAQQLVNKYPGLNVDKIYVDAFAQEITPSGQLAPQVQQAINKTVNDGSLIVNYTGHGGELGWAEEKILGLADIFSWKNEDNLPLFVTATCEFGRYDDPARSSGAELILMAKKNGGIGLVTTTRPVFSNTNFYLNKAFYQAIFEPVAGQMPRLGDVLRKTKNNSLSGSVNRNFSLLGDPSMRIAYPQHDIVLTQLNGKSIEPSSSALPDTLKALGLVTLTGEIRQSGSASRLESFDGTLSATVFDKSSPLTTLGTENDGRPNAKITFALRKNLIFEGKAKVTHGQFTLSFVVPKDIDYRFGQGKISLYARNSQATEDAAGAFVGAIVGGSQPNPATDNQPPMVQLFMNDTTFVSGGEVQREANLLAFISDDSGINIAENGIGHEVTAILNNGDEPIILNRFYSALTDTYKKGVVLYPLKDLPIGKNTLRLKAWDVYNNSSEASLDFIVAENASLALQYVLNYPNPFDTRTNPLTIFEFEHNRAGEDLEITVEIFDVTGQQMKKLIVALDRAESLTQAAAWDGRSDSGMPLVTGIYVYRITARSLKDGSQTSKSNRLILLK